MKKVGIIFIILVFILLSVAITIISLREKKKEESINLAEEKKERSINLAEKTIKINEEIELRKNETVKLEGEEVYLTITEFTNSPPPEGTLAIWSGLGVTYKLKIGDKTYTSNIMGIFDEKDNVPYGVETVDSDYKTYAKVKIEKNENME